MTCSLGQYTRLSKNWGTRLSQS
ncbi:hypothetical protein 3 [Kumasi rhabdovirus]|uniref:Uncharacterized protein n=1 Tax=Kumasi rhabdovirus TaxID=1537975 RepID=A0A0C4MJ39_9RHAB|nr:hypothetical protein 3 [Kumasi rhabdovirus]AIL31434.1 hypothetical protein 3 [Kumasi rhabdovirus]